MSIDQVDRGVADGAADGAGIILGFDALDSGPNGCLGGAVEPNALPFTNSAFAPRSTGSASPPRRIRNEGLGVPAGGEQQAPGRRCRLHDRNRVLLQQGRDGRRMADFSALASTIRAPVIEWQVESSSLPMSKESVVTASITSVSSKLTRRPNDSSRLVKARCGICTLFGLPVEPEVKMT